MKISALVLLLSFPIVMIAGNFQGVSDEEMKKMMQGAQKMKLCMRGINQDEIMAFQTRVHKFEVEINALCRSGKDNLAQSKAVDFWKVMSKDNTTKKIMECSKAMLTLPFSDQYNVCP